MKRFNNKNLKNKKVLLPLLSITVLIVLILVNVTTNNAKSSIEENSVIVTTINLGNASKGQHTVKTIGQVESSSQADIKSQVSGPIKNVYIKIGQTVQPGQVIAEIENSESYARVAQAQASVNIEQARLDELVAGIRQVDLDVVRAKVETSRENVIDTKNNLNKEVAKSTNDLQNLYDQIPDILESSYLLVNDAIRVQTDEMFIDANTDTPKLTFYVSDLNKKIEVKNKRRNSELLLLDLRSDIDKLSNEKIDQENTLDMSLDKIKTMRLLFEPLSYIVSDSNLLTQLEISNYQNKISLSRANINNAINNIINHKQSIKTQKLTMEKTVALLQTNLNSAENSLSLNEYDLISKEAPATPERISAQEAQLSRAQANLYQAQANHNKTIIRSPISGSVITTPIRIGEFISAGKLIASIVDTNGFQIRTYISTSDINNVSIGSLVNIEGDIKGVVTNIAPGIHQEKQKIEILVSILPDKNVTNKKLIIAGQYLNIEIIQDNSNLQDNNSNIYILPISAVKFKNNQSIVYLVDDNSLTQEVIVKVGSILDTNIEIIDGISSNMDIISSIRGINVGQKVKILK